MPAAGVHLRSEVPAVGGATYKAAGSRAAVRNRHSQVRFTAPSGLNDMQQLGPVRVNFGPTGRAALAGNVRNAREADINSRALPSGAC